MSQITVSHLTFAYDGACDNVFEDVSFVLDTDWRLGFTGRNGRGKTTFLKLLDGTLDSRGAVRAGVPVLYFPFPVEYPQDDTQAVLERLLPDCPAWRILRELNLLGVEQDVLYRPFYTMSNGEQTKILLASLFCTMAHSCSSTSRQTIWMPEDAAFWVNIWHRKGIYPGFPRQRSAGPLRRPYAGAEPPRHHRDAGEFHRLGGKQTPAGRA